MKKFTSILLLLVMMLAFAACSMVPAVEENVTIYIPDTVTVYTGDGSVHATGTYLYEEGWKNKESFTVTLEGDAEKLGENGSTSIYTDKKVVYELTPKTVLEYYYDVQGNFTKSVQRFTEEGSRIEVIRTLDANGRLLCEEHRSYRAVDTDPIIETKTYTLYDKENGSEGAATVDTISEVIEYDRNHRLIAIVTYVDGVGRSRSEFAYDDLGNLISQVNYGGGQKHAEIKYTYKAVQVSEQTAARLPQFKRGE